MVMKQKKTNKTNAERSIRLILSVCLQVVSGLMMNVDNYDELYLQHNRIPPYAFVYTWVVFNLGVIRLCATIEMTPSSPDLTAMDFYLCVCACVRLYVVKDSVYEKKPETLEQL